MHPDTHANYQLNNSIDYLIDLPDRRLLVIFIPLNNCLLNTVRDENSQIIEMALLSI